MYTKLCRSGPGYFYLRWFGLHATELSTPSSTLYNTAQKGVRDCHVEQIHSRQPSSSLRSEETNESHSQQDDPIRGTKIITTFPVSTGKKRQRERTAGNYYKRRKALDYLFMDHQWTSVGIACNEVDTDHKNCFYTGPTITLTIISYAGEHSIVLSMYSSSKIQ